MSSLGGVSKPATSHRRHNSGMVGIFRLCSTCLPVSSSSKKQRNPVQPANKTPTTHKPLCRNEVILNLLEQFFKGELQYSIKFTVLPDGYYSLDEIVNLPEFKKENCTAEEIAEAVHSDLLLRFSTRGSKVRLKPPELNKNPDVILSKKLACILRHAAENVGMNYEPGGYLYVDKILQLKPFQGVRVEDILRVVNSNDKKRYEVSTNPENGRLKIRAFQGHSVPIDGLDITLIENPENYPNVIHGTYFRNWESIRKEGLKRMRRTHIHFAPGEIGESGVISGLRSSAEILIYIDLAKAMKDGYKFYISKNNVILCEGNADGCLPTKYFLAAYQRYPRVQLPLTP